MTHIARLGHEKSAELATVHCTDINHAASTAQKAVTLLEAPLARANFKFEKRQKELAKQKKNEEKRLRKLEKRGDGPEETTEPDEIESTEPELNDDNWYK